MGADGLARLVGVRQFFREDWKGTVGELEAGFSLRHSPEGALPPGSETVIGRASPDSTVNGINKILHSGGGGDESVYLV